jgi:phosphohistidine phosphatase
MLRLILLRHAKAVQHAGGSDRHRSLNRRGENDADRMGSYLAAEGLMPALAIVSDAARTRQTLERVLKGLAQPVSVRVEPKVYEAASSTLLAVLQAAPSEIDCLLLVGHNPGMAELALFLAGKGAPSSLARMRAKFPTCGLAVIDFEEAHWPALDFGSGVLERFVTPTDIGGEDD